MRPAVLVTRATFPDIADRLREHFDVEDNPADTVWSRAELIRRLQGKQGVMSTGSERIDAALLDACPQLKAVCNVGVGYNNVDVAACTARGVLVTNTPDVLTETTADFGFALMMATARRITESRALRAPRRVDQDRHLRHFVGSDVHGATLGILGMGRIGQAIARRGALGFGMRVIYHNRTPAGRRASKPRAARAMSTRPRCCARPTTWCWCCRTRPQSHHAIGAAELAQMKPTRDADQHRARRHRRRRRAGRGAARRAHRRGRARRVRRRAADPSGAADLPNVVLTPHIGSASVAHAARDGRADRRQPDRRARLRAASRPAADAGQPGGAAAHDRA